MSLRAVFLGLALLGTAAASAGFGQTAQDLTEAARAVETAAPGRPRRDALAAAVTAHETVIAQLRAQDRDLAVRIGALEIVLATQQDEIEALLAGLQKLPVQGAPVLMVHPDGALAAARAGHVMAGAVPLLHGRARELAAHITQTAGLRRTRQGLATRLENTARQARGLRARLISDHGQRGTAATSAEALAIAAALRAGAADVPELGSAAPPLPPSALPLPVEGRLIARFGDPRPGISILAAPGALVIAPVAMTVRFAGQLQGYGAALVLEPAPNRLLILTGLDTLLVARGEVVTSNSVLGMMPQSAQSGDLTSQTDTFAAIDVDPAGTPRLDALYIETREAEKPVDPLTWFAERKDTR